MIFEHGKNGRIRRGSVARGRAALKRFGRGRFACALGLLVLSLLLGRPQPAAAQAAATCTSCICEIFWQEVIDNAIDDDTYSTSSDGDYFRGDIPFFQQQLLIHESVFMDQYYFIDEILSAMQNMTQQLTTSSMAQMAIIGSFLDAQQQGNVERLLQEKAAQAHKDYQPSLDLCTIGTTARGLAAAQANGNFSSEILQDRLRDREIQGRDTMASNSAYDILSRKNLFLSRYCNASSSGGTFGNACTVPANADTVDKDVSVHRTLWQPASLNLNFADNAAVASDDETDILALNANLYSHEVFSTPSATALKDPNNQSILLDQRGIMAKRSVAQNSFGALVAMKTADSANKNAGAYLQLVLKQLGADDTKNADWAMATGKPPSYDSQMEILTKRIYEDPRFYTNLYDTPANLQRKGAALRAIGLMQHWDTFNSGLRREALLAELVELDVEKAQKDIENRMNSNVSEGAKTQ